MQRPSTWFQKRRMLLLAAMVLSVGLWIMAPATFWQPAQKILVTFTAPFQNVFSWLAFELREKGQFIGSIGGLKEENARLHQEILTLKGHQSKVKALERENVELRQAIGLEPHPGTVLLASEVIARGEGGLATTLRINRGTNKGVQVGMPVVAAGNILIGRIVSVATFTAEVRLLSHHESLVAAMATEIPGHMIVRGDHGVGLLLDLARPTDTLTPGTAIMTSGLSDGLPAGLLIGTIQTVRPSADQLFQQATIVPPVRADSLRFVSVMTAY